MTKPTPKMITSGGDLSDYEALRTHVLTGATGGSHAGLIVLLRQGVAAWMARRSACPSSMPPPARAATPFVGDELRTAIVRVLANVALAGQKEACL